MGIVVLADMDMDDAARLAELRAKKKKRMEALKRAIAKDESESVNIVVHVPTNGKTRTPTTRKRKREEDSESADQPARKRHTYNSYIENDKKRASAMFEDKKRLLRYAQRLNVRTGAKVLVVIVPQENPRTGRISPKVIRPYGCS